MSAWNDLRQFLISIDREATFGTAVAVDRALKIGRAGGDIITAQTELRTDAGLSTTKEQPTEARIGTQFFQGSIPWQWVKPDDLAIALSWVLGTPTSEEADTRAYLHTFSPSAARTLISRTIEEYLAAGVQHKFPGAVANNWTLNYVANQDVDMDLAIIAKGPQSAGSGSGSFVSSEPVWGGDLVTAYIGSAVEESYAPALGTVDLTSETDITAKVRAMTIGIANNISMGQLYDPTANTIGRTERGTRAYRLGLTLELSDRTELDYVKDKTEKAVEVEWDSGSLAGDATQNYGAQFVWPKIAFSQVAPSWSENGKLLGRFEALVMDDGTNGPFLAAVWNKTADYASTP